MKNKQKSFTIIELLVVISIMVLLSSIILVATKGAREKAKVAKIQQLSSNIKHILGIDIVGEWEFENSLNDTFGPNNHAFYTGSEPVYEDGLMGKAVSFNGTDYLEIPDSSSFYPRDYLDITIDVLVKFNDLDGDEGIVWREPHYYLYVWFGELEFWLEGFCCGADLTVNDPQMETGKWYHIVATYSSQDSIMEIYLNGEKVASRDLSHLSHCCYRYDLYEGNPYHDPIVIGGSLNGAIDFIKIYNNGLKLTLD